MIHTSAINVHFFFYILMLVGINAYAQQYNFVQYSISEGLAQSQVYAMEQDSRGYLWFGTQGGGLSRFDGKEFEHFSTKNGLPSNAVFAVYEDSFKNVWIGTNRGISRFDGQAFKMPKAYEFLRTRVETIIQINDSTLWIGAKKGIYEYNYLKDSIYKKTIHPLVDKNIVHKIYKSQKGIWIGTTVGAFFQGKDLHHFNTENGLTGNEVMDFTIDKAGIIWVVTHDGGLNFIAEETLEITLKKNIPNTKKAFCIYKDHQDNIWVGLEERGLYTYNSKDTLWHRITQKEGLPNKNIKSIIQDIWGNIWIGTSGGGVVKYLGQFFVHYDESEGLHGDRIYAMTSYDKGGILFSASSEGLAILDSTGFKKLDIDRGYLDVKCKALLQRESGQIWAGTIGKGILVLDSTATRIINEDAGFVGREVVAMLEAQDNTIWVATNHEGLFNIKDLDSLGLSILNFNREDGLRSQRMTTVKQDKEGRIWFATRLGEIGYLKDGKIERVFREEEGLTYDVSIRSIAFDQTRNLWIGTAGEGILKADLNKDSIYFEPIALNKDLNSYNIYLLIFDKNGDLWAGSERGVDKLMINQSGLVTEVQFFGKNKGFLGIETCQNSSICDDLGNVWFGTMNGLTQHIPSKQQVKIAPPLIHFKNISLFYQPIQDTKYAHFANPKGGLKEGLKLPHHANNISFEFKAVNISNPDDVRYRWRLNGVESQWSPYSKKQSVDYSNLPSGNYTFEVQSISGKQFLSAPITASFFIKKPIWKVWWFQLLMGLLFLSIVGLILWNWKKRLQQREKIKREKLEMENHVLQLEQKALQLQMNPHFIFNALNSIQSLVATKDYTTARQEIGNFAALMRSILSNSRSQKISLQEEIKTLEQYLKMEQFCQRVPFEYEIQLPQNISAEDIELPPMLLQPFVENSIIHGISHLQNKGKLNIHFQLKDKLLQCDIMDNGVGRKKANELRQSHKPGHQSVAMSVTKERLEALRGEMKYIPLVIADILKNDQVKGTKVSVIIPIEENF